MIVKGEYKCFYCRKKRNGNISNKFIYVKGRLLKARISGHWQSTFFELPQRRRVHKILPRWIKMQSKKEALEVIIEECMFFYQRTFVFGTGFLLYNLLKNACCMIIIDYSTWSVELWRTCQSLSMTDSFLTENIYHNTALKQNVSSVLLCYVLNFQALGFLLWLC